MPKGTGNTSAGVLAEPGWSHRAPCAARCSGFAKLEERVEAVITAQNHVAAASRHLRRSLGHSAAPGGG